MHADRSALCCSVLNHLWGHTLNRRTILLSMLAGVAIAPVRASGPVPHTASGCVRDGRFSNRRGNITYVYKVRDAGTNELADLSPYEGKRVMISGNLLPGDNFFPTAPIQILGKCR